MTSLQNWKDALASGATVEELLGLACTKENPHNQEDKEIFNKTFQENLIVESFLKEIQQFKWCSASLLSMEESSDEFAVIPPNLPVKDILGQVIIGTKEEPEKNSDTCQRTN